MSKRKASWELEPDPGVLDLFEFAREVNKLANRVEGIIKDLSDFGFDAGVACIDHPDALGVRVRLQVNGFMGDPVSSPDWQWCGPGLKSFGHFGPRGKMNFDGIMSQLSAVSDYLRGEYGIDLDLVFDSSLIMSTPTISAGRIGGKAREAKGS